MSKYATEYLETCPNASEMSQVDLLAAEELFLTPAHFPLPKSNDDLTDGGKIRKNIMRKFIQLGIAQH